MAEPIDKTRLDRSDLHAFTRALLEDAQALERMLAEGIIESGIRRIGAEQEMFLVDPSMRPARTALSILEDLDDQHFKTELALFNLELNLDPQRLRGDCLRRMHNDLFDLLEKARAVARRYDTLILLTGILPTARRKDLTIDSMTPDPRYLELNRITAAQRTEPFRLSIQGIDDLELTHDNILFEACNTSFQIHFQVAGDEFARLYNLAQVISAPLLAGSVNSPIFLQHRLWKETRLALFRQSIDSRSTTHQERQAPSRVIFGNDWVKESVLEIFREDIARFRVFLPIEVETSPLEVLDQGEIPRLKALCTHNGTVYRWNRPCYGILDGKPHLRIEHRALSSGPTITDEIANAAFFHGLMTSLTDRYDDVTKVMSFSAAKNNFLAAAQYGLDARFVWLEGRAISAEHLILDELIQLARDGLASKELDSTDIDHYLGVFEKRVASRRTGSQWFLDSLEGMAGKGKPEQIYQTVTRRMYDNHLEDRPVHEWDTATIERTTDWRDSCRTVEQIMTTDLFTVREEDLIDLAASLMDWEHIRHVPVENDEAGLVGLVTHRQILRLISRGVDRLREPVAVRDVMMKDPVTVLPDTSTLEAIQKMRNERVSCLLVVDEQNKLVGIITERDFVMVSAGMLEDSLRE